jgi:hypothetical protein
VILKRRIFKITRKSPLKITRRVRVVRLDVPVVVLHGYLLSASPSSSPALEARERLRARLVKLPASSRVNAPFRRYKLSSYQPLQARADGVERDLWL